jgi:hypothetical protein
VLLPDVVLDFNIGMKHRPKISRSNECQGREQILDAFGAKGSPQRLPGALGPAKINAEAAKTQSSISLSGAGQSMGPL